MLCGLMSLLLEHEENFELNTKKTNFAPFSKFLTKYRLILRISSGAKSKIFVVHRRIDNVPFICKRVLTNEIRPEEWEIPNYINSDRVIKILEKYTNIAGGIGYTYLIMTYYPDAMDVFDYIVHLNHYTENTLKPIILEMAKAIKVVHDMGYIHLDVKFENFIVVAKNPLKIIILDFEFSRDANFSTRRVCGTKRYMAPEVNNCLSCKKSDVYSLGCVLFYAITSELYNYNNTYDMDIIFKEKMTSDLMDLLVNCLSKSIEHRYSIDDVINHSWFKESTDPIPILSSSQMV
jgi:serine/threonine protein kinase